MEDISMAVTLTKEVVADQWSMLVENAGDKVDQVFKDTEDNIKKSQAPDVNIERVKVSQDFLEGALLNKERDFLRVTNKNLSKYEMYIGVRKYGVHLDLVWYLIYEPGFITQMLNLFLAFLKRKLVLNLKIFDEHDLKVHGIVIHDCFLKAVEKLTKESGSNQAIVRKTTGFLGIS
jgi:hypothetical protein